MPVSIHPLKEFLLFAYEVLDNNVAPALMSWSSMYSLQLYQKFIQEMRHCNVPILFGDSTVGKTLIAVCGAWLNGCQDIHIASRQVHVG